MFHFHKTNPKFLCTEINSFYRHLSDLHKLSYFNLKKFSFNLNYEFYFHLKILARNSFIYNKLTEIF